MTLAGFEEVTLSDKQLLLMAKKIAEQIPERETYKYGAQKSSPLTPINWRMMESRWDTVVTLTAALEKAQSKGDAEAAKAENQKLVNALRDAHAEIVIIASELERRNSFVDASSDVNGILHDLKKLRDMRDVPFVSCKFYRGNTAAKTYIEVITEEITLDYTDLNGKPAKMNMGQFCIRMNLWEYSRSRPMNVTPMSEDSRSGHGYYHPHMSGGVLCEGDHGGVISTALDEGLIVDALTMWLAILRVYNPGAAYHEMDVWDESDDDEDDDNAPYCDDCGDPTYGEDYSCQGCHERIACAGCTATCVWCSNSLCSNCRTTCDACSESTCSNSDDCVGKCAKCDRTCCTACLAETNQHGWTCPEDAPEHKQFAGKAMCERCMEQIDEEIEAKAKAAEDAEAEALNQESTETLTIPSSPIKIESVIAEAIAEVDEAEEAKEANGTEEQTSEEQRQESVAEARGTAYGHTPYFQYNHREYNDES